MFKHHQETITKVVEAMRPNEDILAVLLVGSICHGFARESSDVDIMILINNDAYQIRKSNQALTFFSTELSTYEDGYVDGKYICLDYLETVAESANEATRYAFDNAQILFTKVEGVDVLLNKIVSYPVDKKQENTERFLAQFEAWKWYCGEALKHNNSYLLHHSVNKLVLFGGRLILTHNKRLFPYHKWFIRVIEEVQHKPDNFSDLINRLVKTPNEMLIDQFYNDVMNFADWGVIKTSWPNQFAIDSELPWMDDKASVDDI